MSEVKKNTAGQGIYQVLVDSSDGSAITTGASISIDLDGANTASAGAGTLTHISNGLWHYAFTQAETNADLIGFVFSGTNVTPAGGAIYTTTKTLDDLNDLAQSDVLSDATPFAGANIDATISSRLAASAAPTNFGDMSITATTGLVDITQTAADKAWSTTTRVLTANTNLNDPTAATIADSVWDEARSGHTSAGTFGEGVASVQGNVTGSVGSISGVTFPTNFSDLSIAVTTGRVDVGTIEGSDATDQLTASVWDVADGEEAGIPAAAAAFRDKVNFVFALHRNKITQTSTTFTLRNDGDTADVAAYSVSDDGTTFTRGEGA